MGLACTVRVLLACVLLGGLVSQASLAAQRTRFEIGLIGDLPYTGEDEAKFPNLMLALNDANLSFVVHMGDIESDARGYQVFRTGTKPCTDGAFDTRKALFNTAKHPFILTPGDNDWTDCRYSEPSFDPTERLARLREVFFSGDRSLGQRTLTLTRQSADPRYAKFRENARWTFGGVCFVTLHTVGSNDNLGVNAEGDAEFAERNAANLAWLKQAFEQARHSGSRGIMILTQANPGFETRGTPTADRAKDAGTPPTPAVSAFGDLLDALERETLAYGKPVVFVHGDTHYFRIDKPLLGTKSGRTIENFTRVEVFGSPNVHWVLGTVDPDDPEVFTFKAEIVRRNLVDHGTP